MTRKSAIHFLDNPGDLDRTLRDILDGKSAFYVADAHTAPIFTQHFGFSPDVITAPGEESKSLMVLTDLWRLLLEKGLTRKDYLVAFGGGSITDLAGLAASTYKRGLGLIHIPTTLIGMVDAASGGKTAIDFGGIKNSIGSFYLPDHILIAPDLLQTLPPEEILSGKGEILKYALLTGDDPETMLQDEHLPRTVRRCLEYKEAIVSQDLRDAGTRQVLNLGHTAGHALEALHLNNPRYAPVPHGIAVAAGIVIECYLSFVQERMTQSELMRIARLVKEYFPAVSFACKDDDEIWGYALQDKKNAASGTAFTTCMLLDKPGGICKASQVFRRDWDEAMDFYKDFFGV